MGQSVDVLDWSGLARAKRGSVKAAKPKSRAKERMIALGSKECAVSENEQMRLQRV